MAVKLTVDTSGYTQAIKAWAAQLTDKDLPQVMREEMGLLVERCIQLTPPPHGKGSQQAAKQLGEGAVNRDVNRLFRPMSGNLSEYGESVFAAAKDLASQLRSKRLSEAIERLSAKGDLAGLKKILSNMKVGTGGILYQATEDIHTKNRDRRGRVRKSSSPYFVSEGKSLARLLALKIKHVGGIKAGWLAAALRYKTKNIPAWVSRHGSGNGSFAEQFTKRGGFVEAVNSAKGIVVQNSAARIVATAIQTRTRDVLAKMQRMVNRRAAEWSRTSRRASR